MNSYHSLFAAMYEKSPQPLALLEFAGVSEVAAQKFIEYCMYYFNETGQIDYDEDSKIPCVKQVVFPNASIITIRSIREVAKVFLTGYHSAPSYVDIESQSAPSKLRKRLPKKH